MALGRVHTCRGCRARRTAGFTLLEIALCIVIVGTGIAAIMAFMGSATRVNTANTHTSIAVQLARAGWEIAFDQGYDIAKTWIDNPPTTSPALATYPTVPLNFARRIWVENGNINSLTGAPGGAVGDTVRVNVEIYYSNALLYKQTWILTNPNP